ncbi:MULTISPECIES: Tim44/TimA family putative adaptor protein [unclassified Shinella]|jgi:predicted lipid-binding transport protein (Tim44 family)|uniref:Tim44/TimA family putative adaptor protein n=1 Tax=unclassified Shinella TaxID=2643062 RepID=UPI0003C56709|nr:MULTISPECIES: Tim44/TimA family putative adaptor protein [unclassified Shinella]MCA0338510.1 Tim44/TimA family putative adaptor protein [Pseudomonadota bacterium]EYR78866.1 putative import inner membrane translocase, subunit Tim44 [Shinella sp. DD12]KNY14999.1 calcium-binding protein [Shinella sp. SUS2]KOC74651.1 calcium-binding protein [Shinella sp. GWS1]MCO5154357.1 Tim44/TimA family putative adaptor protein [Shinella sp.]
MGSFDFVTIFFLVAAVVIFLQLRSVLGRRTGNERPPFDPYSKREAAGETDSADRGKVVTLPRRDGTDADENPYASVDSFAAPGTPLNEQLRQLVKVDPSFNPKEFVNGARMAYEMIVVAFADGDRKALKNLLSREVYEGFDAAISDRESKGEVVRSSFVGIEKADIVSAEAKDSEANVTLRIVSQLISATYDKAGTLIEGDAETVAEVNDLWTFARDTRSRDPNWKLIATESEG